MFFRYTRNSAPRVIYNKFFFTVFIPVVRSTPLWIRIITRRTYPGTLYNRYYNTRVIYAWKYELVNTRARVKYYHNVYMYTRGRGENSTVYRREKCTYIMRQEETTWKTISRAYGYRSFYYYYYSSYTHTQL